MPPSSIVSSPATKVDMIQPRPLSVAKGAKPTTLATILTILVLGCGCQATRVERPYVKETETKPDGTMTVRESSADWVTGGMLDAFKKGTPAAQR